MGETKHRNAALSTRHGKEKPWGIMARSGAGCLTIIGLIFLAVMPSGCGVSGRLGRKGAPVGVTLTQPSYYTAYYSTRKARYLGEKYSHQLDQLLEQIVQSPVGRLQFANNIVSVSMGFFTHAAAQPPDERYLEVLLAMPDILQESPDLSMKLEQLFSQYGQELLAILSSDTEIYNDNAVAGYGLNFSWRSLAQTPSGPRLNLEGAVVYISKEEVRRFLTRQLDQQELLERAAIFSRQGEHPAKLVRHSPISPQPLVRALTQQESGEKVPQVPLVVLPPEVKKQEETHTPEPFTLPGEAPQHEVSVSIQDEVAVRLPTASPGDTQQHEEPPAQGGQDSASQKTWAATPLPKEPRQSPITQGYLIQLSFSKSAEAQPWSDRFSGEGYSTSMSTAEGGQLVRLRIGSFPSLAKANDLLARLRAQGLRGLILQVTE